MARYDAHYSPSMKALDRQFGEMLPGWWYITGHRDSSGNSWARVSELDGDAGINVIRELPLPATTEDALRSAMEEAVALLLAEGPTPGP
jgi:hypothetical protein